MVSKITRGGGFHPRDLDSRKGQNLLRGPALEPALDPVFDPTLDPALDSDSDSDSESDSGIQERTFMQLGSAQESAGCQFQLVAQPSPPVV